MSSIEQQAVRSDAERWLAELKAVREALLPDADDAFVLSELVTVDSKIAAAKEALR